MWYLWIQVLLDTIPDIGPGSMYRGLRQMNPTRDSVVLAGGVLLCRIVIALLIKRRKKTANTQMHTIVCRASATPEV
jgi:hypothetical protein